MHRLQNLVAARFRLEKLRDLVFTSSRLHIFLKTRALKGKLPEVADLGEALFGLKRADSTVPLNASLSELQQELPYKRSSSSGSTSRILEIAERNFFIVVRFARNSR